MAKLEIESGRELANFHSTHIGFPSDAKMSPKGYPICPEGKLLKIITFANKILILWI